MCTMRPAECVCKSRPKRPRGAAPDADQLSLRLLPAAAGFAAGAVTMLIWGLYPLGAHESGAHRPQAPIGIYATQPGTLVEQNVSPGQYVHRGDTLFVLCTAALAAPNAQNPQSPVNEAATTEALEQRLASAQQQAAKQRLLSDLQIRGLRAQQKETAEELALLRSETATQEQRIASARQALERYEQLLPQHYVSQEQVQQRRDDLLDQEARLQELTRIAVGLRREQSQSSLELAKANLQSADQQQTSEREQTSLQRQLSASRAPCSIRITAPSDGTVTSILAKKGDTAAPRMLLLSIQPAAQPHAAGTQLS